MHVYQFVEKKSGQVQLLTAAVMTLVAVASALSIMDFTIRNFQSRSQIAKRTEMRSALREAIKHAYYIYYNESSCDPVVLDSKLSRLDPVALDGTILETFPAAGTGPRRHMNVQVGSHTYLVSFGAVERLAWDGNSIPAADPTIQNIAGVDRYFEGTSQDAVLEVSTSNFSRIKMSQRAALINNCSHPCSYTESGNCEVASDRAVSYHRILDPPNFAFGTTTVVSPDDTIWGAAGKKCFDTRYFGDLTSAVDSQVCLGDLAILKNYLRSGDFAGSSTDILIGAGGVDGCADFNSDGLVNEIDLNILEKVLRGYIYWLPSHY